MSQFLSQWSQYRKHFKTGWSDNLKVLNHYPILKDFYLRKKDKSFPLAKIWPQKILKQNYKSLNGKPIKLVVGNDDASIDNFREIFFGMEYAGPLPFAEIKSLVDLGANQGFSSVYFATRCPLEKAVLVEANPQLIETLKKQSQGVADEVKVINAFISGKQMGEMDFTIHEDHRVSQSSDSEQTVKVPQKPLRELLEGLPHPRLLKMDIEGAEYDLFNEDSLVFNGFDYFAIELHGDRAKRDAWIKDFQALGIKVLDRDLQDAYDCEVFFAAK